MNTRELIAKLQASDPSGNMDVEVAIRVDTKAYPVAYVDPFDVSQVPGAVRVYCSLPEHMTVMRRKCAA
jgi:hypothetical protein